MFVRLALELNQRGATERLSIAFLFLRRMPIGLLHIICSARVLEGFRRTQDV